MAELQDAAILAEAGKHQEASKILHKFLNRNPEDVKAVYILGEILLKEECYGLANVIFKYCCEKMPGQWECWNNLGRCQEEIYRWDDAEKSFQEALKLNTKNSFALGNMGMIAVNKAQPEKAISLINKAIAIEPDNQGFRFNRGLAHLMLRNWRQGWVDYETHLGKSRERKERKYQLEGELEPRWDGSKDKTIICYGEQGIGDQINFASCLPDLIRDSKRVVIDIDKRLQGLFQRSFPTAEVHGDLYNDHPTWLGEHVDAGVAIGGLPNFYRNADEDFPGNPYLVADPERRIQWRALFDSLPGKKIGLAWNGGVFRTGHHRRSLSLEQLKPMFAMNPGNTWVSLEYKEPELRGFEFIKHWQRGPMASDYDDTAAMVAELDLVVTVQTAIVHLSGALGVKCFCMVPDRPRFIYLLEGEKMPWYGSIKLFRQKFGKWPIPQVAQEIKCLP